MLYIVNLILNMIKSWNIMLEYDSPLPGLNSSLASLILISVSAATISFSVTSAAVSLVTANTDIRDSSSTREPCKKQQITDEFLYTISMPFMKVNQSGRFLPQPLSVQCWTNASAWHLLFHFHCICIPIGFVPEVLDFISPSFPLPSSVLDDLQHPKAKSAFPVFRLWTLIHFIKTHTSTQWRWQIYIYQYQSSYTHTTSDKTKFWNGRAAFNISHILSELFTCVLVSL